VKKKTPPRFTPARTLVLLLFLLSGATGLIYEITWMRSLGAIFGNTVFASSTVLSTFMLGLALGSLLLGRIADRLRRPLKCYALLELAIAVYALAFPWLLMAVDRFYLWFYRAADPSFAVMTLVRFAVSMLLMLIPTVLMGGTLPILSALWNILRDTSAAPSRAGRSVGYLYAVNTLGAVAGAFLTGYFLIRLLGVNRTITITAAVNTGIAALAWWISRRLPEGPTAAPSGVKAPPPAQRRPADPAANPRTTQIAVLAAVFLAGFCALALEVLWTRVLVFVLETSAYAFTCMLTCFVFGLATGSLLASRWLVPRLKNPLFALGIIEFLLGLAVTGSIYVLGLLWAIDLYIIQRLPMGTSLLPDMTAHFLDTLTVVLVPTLLMGMVFPVAVEACAATWQNVGRRVGQVYAWNTLGCVLGSFAAGFLLIPRFGLRDSFLGIIAVLLVLAVGLVWFSERRVRWAVPAAAVALGVLLVNTLAIPRDVFLRTMNTYHYPSEIVYMHDDATGTVTVHDLPDGDRLIVADGVDVAGMNLMLRTTQKLQAYAPLLVHDDPRDVVQIGYGSGETCGIGLDFGVPNYTIVDVSPGIFTAGKFFDEINRGSYAHPRLRKVIMDGKNFIKLTPETFDVIMNDSTYPGTTGSSALYTYDHFLACRQRLKPGGLLSCWVPLDLRPEDFRIIVRSFQAAMPHSSLWMVNNCLNKHAVFIGTLEPTRLDFQRIESLMARPGVAADLREISVHTVYDFLDCMSVDPPGMKKLGGNGPLHTDDHPHLEYGTAVKRDIEASWLAVLYAIGETHGPLLPYVTNLPPAKEGEEAPQTILQRYTAGTKYTFLGTVGMLEGNPQLMNRAFELAREANPYDRDVASILQEMGDEIRAYETELQNPAGKADLRPRLAKRYMLLEDYGRAARQYERYLAAKPADAPARNQLGICYQQIGRLDLAAQCFREAISQDPSLHAAHANLADVTLAQGNNAGAIQILENALKEVSRSDLANVHEKLADFLDRAGLQTRALRHIDHAMAITAGDSARQQELNVIRQQIQAGNRTDRP
jgi:spermidine synthase